VVAEQIPYQFATYSIGFRPDSNISPDIPFNVYDITRIRVYDRQLMGLLSYPLSRVERLEFSAGIENLGFSEEIESDYYDAFGNLQDVTRNDVATTLTSLTMGVARAALVYDNATYGATSPILGSRWRLDASPSVGSLEYASLGFDYRKYIVPVRPFTIAGRVIHYGRYGPDAESPRIGPYFLGYQSGVRGYDYGSFDGTECHPNGTDSCPVFTQLFGTKLFAANAEIRFPLLGLLGVGDGFYGFFPIELGAFADAGLAWNDFNRPQVLSFLDKTAPTVPRRDWVTSAGGLLRINVFGYAIAELDYVRPFGRPDKGWMWQFGISPGGF
jgi:outer membrane protein assembly factor BamA